MRFLTYLCTAIAEFYSIKYPIHYVPILQNIIAYCPPMCREVLTAKREVISSTCSNHFMPCSVFSPSIQLWLIHLYEQRNTILTIGKGLLAAGWLFITPTERLLAISTAISTRREDFSHLKTTIITFGIRCNSSKSYNIDFLSKIFIPCIKFKVLISPA